MTTLILVVAAVTAMVVVTSRASTLTARDGVQLSATTGSSPGTGEMTRTADQYTRARLAAAGRPSKRGAPLWRRVIGLVALVAIWTGIGLAVAAVIGGAAAGAALLLQSFLT